MKVLLIRMSAMGDIIMTSPVVRWIHEQLRAEIHFLTKASYVELLAHHPQIDKIYSLDPKLSVTISALHTEKYDLVIDLHKNLRSIRITTSLGVPSVSFDKLSLEKWMYLKLGVNRLRRSHVIERYAQALQNWVVDDGLGMDFHIDPLVVCSFQQPYASYQVIVAGGTYATKRMPLHIIQELISEQDQSYVLLGGGDVDPDIASLSSPNLLNLIYKTSIHEAATYLQQAALVITGDTGLMHVAAALNKKIVVIWGSTSEEFGFYPYYGHQHKDLHQSVTLDLSCQPCSKYGIKSCPKGHMNCLKQLNIEQVRAAIAWLS